MLRKVVMFIMITVCFILQNSVFNALSLGSVAPNLLIVLTSSLGFMRGKKSGMFTGLVCGLYVDIFFGSFIGFYALVYMYLGYINGFFHKIFYDDDIKLPMVLITASDFVYGLIIYVCLYLVRGRFDFTYYLLRIILPEVIYTLVITVLLYQLIRLINRKLMAVERRSERKFV